MKYRILGLILLMQFAVIAVFAQTTEFTYQGSLKDGAAAATGNYDFEFRLYDAPGGGSQIGSTNNRSGVAVTTGIFSVNLDFGSGFPGGDRYLEISVKTSGGGAFSVLSPRQRIASSPYSIKSINASNADNATSAVAATNFTGNLSGDVTGTQASTTVARLQSRNVANTAPTDGQVLKYNAATSQWRPDTDNTGAGGGGTITGVTAGTGLTGGGVTGTVAVNIANSGVGTAQIADNNVTDPKINSVSGAKVTGAVATATNSTQLGGIAANLYVQTNDTRLTDARTPTAGSSNYIQNQFASPQASSSFNISGNGVASGMLSAAVVNASTRYDIGGVRILGNPGTGNLFAGVFAGISNTGAFNSFFGHDAGNTNSAANRNSFFGYRAGYLNGTGGSNSFFGSEAGLSNTTNGGNAFFGSEAGKFSTGSSNSIFGWQAGFQSTAASDNAFFGSQAGYGTTGERNSFFGSLAGGATDSGTNNSAFGYLAGNNIGSSSSNSFFGSQAGQVNTGSSNSFFGIRSGGNNSTGAANSFFGRQAGGSNTTGDNNTMIGENSNVDSGNLSFATALGAQARASLSNSVYLGRPLGQDTVRIAGRTIMGDLLLVDGGTDAEPGSGGYIVAGSTASTNVVLDNNEIMARSNGAVATLAINADGGNVNLIQAGTGSVGIGTSSPGDKLDVDGDIRVGTSGTNGCLKNNNGGTIAGTCSSDIRFKQRISPFSSMLNKVAGLRPVSYYWRPTEFPAKGFGNAKDFGLIAQEVEQIMPEIVSEDSSGYKQIDYARLPLMTIQAVKELNLVVNLQQDQIKRQQAEIDLLKNLVCRSNRRNPVCRKK